MNPLQIDFLVKAQAAAAKVSHPFPAMAACEAALESAFGASGLAKNDNNLFGMKQHAHAIYGTVTLPTREFLLGEWKTVTSQWVNYPDWASCFADRFATLQRLSNVYSHYKAALAAPNAETYIAEVSKTWSTDPQRANKVLAIYNEFTGEHHA